jgi:hypothetical protein
MRTTTIRAQVAHMFDAPAELSATRRCKDPQPESSAPAVKKLAPVTIGR